MTDTTSNGGALGLFSLEGQVALVTGAGRGLGFEIARGLAAAGALVLVNGRDEANLAAAVARIAVERGRAQALAFNVADDDAARQAIDRIVAEHGKLDILINNVGVRDRRGILDFDMASVRTLIDVDLNATFNMCRLAARAMAARGAGRIVNITSVTALLGAKGDAAYAAAKGGICSLTRAMAAELGGHGINVNAIAPGPFATEINEKAAASDAGTAWLKGRSALGRWGQPGEIAGAAIFLSAAASSFVTGQILVVDGGLASSF